jgi:site-specific recombinase XerD
LRHSFAQRVYARSGDILVVKQALCHRSLASSLIYTRVDEKRLRKVLA